MDTIICPPIGFDSDRVKKFSLLDSRSYRLALNHVKGELCHLFRRRFAAGDARRYEGRAYGKACRLFCIMLLQNRRDSGWKNDIQQVVAREQLLRTNRAGNRKRPIQIWILQFPRATADKISLESAVSTFVFPPRRTSTSKYPSKAIYFTARCAAPLPRGSALPGTSGAQSKSAFPRVPT